MPWKWLILGGRMGNCKNNIPWKLINELNQINILMEEVGCIGVLIFSGKQIQWRTSLPKKVVIVLRLCRKLGHNFDYLRYGFLFFALLYMVWNGVLFPACFYLCVLCLCCAQLHQVFPTVHWRAGLLYLCHIFETLSSLCLLFWLPACEGLVSTWFLLV